ncbi:MAG: radical SAM protein [Planctomycetota bacterium]|nr:radical SAM protein [Planctomycetota bacterium]
MGFLANYVRNLASLAAGRTPRRPLLFSYYLTHRCPLACRYCSDGQGRPFKEDLVEELSTGQARELIDLLRPDSDTLDITGGEPMCRGDLEELLSHARRVGFRTVLNTKGAGLPQRPDLMRLSDVLVLSVDSLDRARLAGILGGPPHAAHDVLEALHWALANRGRYKSQLVLSAVAMADNLDDVSDVLRLAVSHKLMFQVSPHIVGTAVHPGLIGNERFVALMDEAIAAKAAGAGVLGVLPYLRGLRDGRDYTCHPLLMPTIRPDGAVNLPCLERPRERVSVKDAGGYRRTLTRARLAHARTCEGRGNCRIFCHMALSLLQRRPLAALRELASWRTTPC